MPADSGRGRYGAAALTPTTVERSRSRPSSLARFRTRLMRGALNAAPEKYDETPQGNQEVAHRGRNTKRHRQNIRKMVADDIDTDSNFSLIGVCFLCSHAVMSFHSQPLLSPRHQKTFSEGR
ncbi:hypothetical protein MRX96_035907 [Rhipicephalus microplus]